ncbi:MAG: PD40 domain-containing protein [Anaerolineae bacterium]|nr:PD40 domain-containing protein [Anaerolineae bacterium]
MYGRRWLVPGLLLALVVIALAVLIYTVVLNNRAPVRTPIALTPGAITGDNPLMETREILFMSNRDGDWDLYTLALADRSVTNLTDNDADDGFASYSADGSAITFLSNRDGALNPYMMDADGSNVHPVANDLPTILSVLGSGRLNWDFADRWEAASAFVSLRDLNLEVYLGDAGGERNLTRNGAVDWYPAWSPDGSQIAFASDRDGNQEIYVMDADGGSLRRLTDAPGDDLYPMWQGSVLVFMSDRDIPFARGQIGLYSIDLAADDPQIQRVGAETTVSWLDPQIWRESGTQIYAANGDGDWDIYLADGVGRHVVNLSDNDADDLFAVWRPQNR